MAVCHNTAAIVPYTEIFLLSSLVALSYHSANVLDVKGLDESLQAFTANEILRASILRQSMIRQWLSKN